MHWDRQTGQQYKQFQKIRRAKRLPHRVAEIVRIGGRLNLMTQRLDSNHLRVTDFNVTVDVHPLHRNYYNCTTGERGVYSDVWDLLLDCFRRNTR